MTVTTSTTSASRQIHINVPLLTRVEGEGALDLTIIDNQISDLKFRIFEPPRFFEKFVEGRDYHEVPDLVARICGLCPVAPSTPLKRFSRWKSLRGFAP